MHEYHLFLLSNYLGELHYRFYMDMVAYFNQQWDVVLKNEIYVTTREGYSIGNGLNG